MGNSLLAVRGINHKYIVVDRSEQSAWISFLATDSLATAQTLMEDYPWLREIYEEMAEYLHRPEEVLGMFSEALKIMDENTVQYMIELQQQQLEEARGLLSETQGQLSETQGQLSETQGQLSETQGQLSETQGQLSETQGQLSETQGQLSETQGQLSETQGQLSETQGQLNETKDQLQKSLEMLVKLWVMQGVPKEKIPAMLQKEFGLSPEEAEKMCTSYAP